MDYLFIAGLVILSGLFSGLTIGLMSLSYQELEMASDLGNKEAKRILPIIKEQNLLLVTLLLGNTAVNSTLSIFLGSIVGAGLIAGLISTVVILIFGEILPASVLSKHAIKVGSISAPIVNGLLYLLYPITKPIAFTLDKLIGVDGDRFFSKKELIYIMDKHAKSKQSSIDEFDNKTMKGTLLLSSKTAKEHMSTNIFSFDISQNVNFETLQLIKDSGFTRIPILQEGICVGIVNVKDFIDFDINAEVPISKFMKTSKFRVFPKDKHLDDILSVMIKKHIHISLIYDKEQLLGVLTLEDILEELILSEIVDEFD